MRQQLRWLQAPGDTLFAIGAFIKLAFVFSTRSHRTITAAEEHREVVSAK